MATRQVKNESILMFDFSKTKQKALVIGRVIKIEKGSELDIVYIDAGVGNIRKIIAKSIATRKQLSTLKVGVYMLAYCQVPKFEYGQHTEMMLNAVAFWGAYVPNHYDRVNLENEQEEQEMIDKLSEEKEESIGDFLSQFEDL